MRLLLAANNQATRRNEIIKSYLQLGSSSNRYAPRLPQQETKSSTKQLPPRKTFSKPASLKRASLVWKVAQPSAVCLAHMVWNRLYMAWNLTRMEGARPIFRWSGYSYRFGLHRHRPKIEKVGSDGSQRGNQRLPWQGTAGSQTLKLTVPNLGTRGYHCKELPVPRS